MGHFLSSDDVQSRVLIALMKIDAAIRSGQFVSAYRATNKLYKEISRGEILLEDQSLRNSLLSSIRRTILFIKPMVDAYAQNQTSINLIRGLNEKTKEKVNK